MRNDWKLEKGVAINRSRQLCPVPDRLSGWSFCIAQQKIWTPALLLKPGQEGGPGSLHPTRRTSVLTSSALLDSSSHGSSSEDPGEEAVPCEPGPKRGSGQVPADQGWQRGQSWHSSPTTREMMSNLCPEPVSHSGRGQALLTGEKAGQGGCRLFSALTVSLDVHASMSQS